MRETEYCKQEGGAIGPSHSCTHLTVALPREAIDKAACMDDFFKLAGLAEQIKDGTIADIRQLWMNDKQCEQLREAMHKNARKDKRWKHLSDHHLATAVGMDYLNYSPVAVAYVPPGQLWIWDKEDRKTAMDEYRQWHRENREVT